MHHYEDRLLTSSKYWRTAISVLNNFRFRKMAASASSLLNHISSFLQSDFWFLVFL